MVDAGDPGGSGGCMWSSCLLLLIICVIKEVYSNNK
jgi:hypothetical protein